MKPVHLEFGLVGELALGDNGRKPKGPSVKAASRTEAANFTNLDALIDSGSLFDIKTLSVALQGPAWVPAMSRNLPRLIEGLPALQAVIVNPKGTDGRKQAPPICELRDTAASRGLRFSVDIVLDAEADAIAALGRQPTSLMPVLDLSRALRIKGVEVRWLVPVLSALTYRVEAIFSLARDTRVEPVLMPARMAGASFEPPDETLSADEIMFLRDFIAYRLLDEERERLSPERVRFYRALHDSLGDSEAYVPADNGSVTALRFDDSGNGASWHLHHQTPPMFRRMADETGAAASEPTQEAPAGRVAGRTADVGGVLLEGKRAFRQWIAAKAAGLLRRGVGAEPGEQYYNVLIIGAYGGEHIGDAAILGGVLFRIHERYGTTRAVLMSQRPTHTRHLVPMLDTPVEVRVETYEQSKARELMPGIDAVVFAGGPLMDLPKQLVRHLYTVSLAARNNKPFIIEGIGAGPFVRRSSEWTARRLVRMARRVSVRTSADSEARLMRGLEHVMSGDPAFDYLDTRGAALTRLPEADREWVEKLLRDTEGRVKVGLNLRPIRHQYTSGTSAGRRVEYTRFVVARFEERLAEGMRRYHQASSAPPCFVFFPMNAIQFGSSDLRSAYRIKRLLGRDVDFRIWQADPSIDGVVSLLRGLDMVIAMRFHAAIFGLSQKRRVVGIDYRPGKRDKVAALLGDLGDEENCHRIDIMTAEWLHRRLSALSEPN